jgi:hypothetical protein
VRHFALLEDEYLEDMYGSYRSLSRTHRVAGQWALARWCEMQSRLVLDEIMYRFRQEQAALADQLSLLDLS